MDAMQIFTALSTAAGRADPYPHYAALHELGEAISIAPGTVLVVGYDAISAVLRDPSFAVSDQAEFDENFPGWQANPVFVQAMDWILNLNGPKHVRIRSLIARAFTARRVAGLEPAIIRVADELLDAIADRGADGSTVEFMHDFAYLLPVTVICELIGIPEADRAGFRPVARDLAEVFEINDAARLPVINAAAAELQAYFTGLAARRRAEPRDDLITDLLAIADSADGRLTDAELLHNLTLLLVAGFETTTNLLGNGLQIMLDQPPTSASLRDGSVPSDAFVAEVLRYDSPVQLTTRHGYDTQDRRRSGGRRRHRDDDARRGKPGPAALCRAGRLPAAARGRRSAELRRRRPLLHWCGPGQARGQRRVPAPGAPVPEAGRGW